MAGKDGPVILERLPLNRVVPENSKPKTLASSTLEYH
jgi:hypothetical protein